jgi:hypothetical protein
VKGLLIALALTSTCASLPSKPSRLVPSNADIVAQAPAGVRYGITDGGYTGVPFSILGRYCDWGGALVRSPVKTADQANVILDSERPCPTVKAHLLFEQNTLDVVDAVAPVLAANADKAPIAECGNELELKPLELDIQAAAWFVGECAHRLRQEGYTGEILTAAIYTIDTDQLARLRAYHAACPDCGCAIHWYGGDVTPWKAAIARVGCPEIDITETGAVSRTASEDIGQSAYFAEQLPGLWSIGAKVIEAYQRASGPGTTDLDNFGWERTDHSWKNVEQLWRLLISKP